MINSVVALVVLLHQGNDREMMTSDAGGGVYYGGVASYDGAKRRLALSDAAGGTQPGGVLCVLDGTGTGECRRVVNCWVDDTGTRGFSGLGVCVNK